VRVLRCGSRAALVELESLPQVLGLHTTLREDPPQGVTGLVPAARTVLVNYDPAVIDFHGLRAHLTRLPVTEVRRRDGKAVEVPVHYDGEDLEDVARMTGLSPREVVARHAGGEHTVAFCGFAPGFAYITGLDPALHVSRRDSPRTKVPAGSIALADEFTGHYPRESPGGWQIIGRTELRVWDLDRDPPMLLLPGTRVRFVEAGP
jgi:KipI family sensor histidine kinase inhibitor